MYDLTTILSPLFSINFATSAITVQIAPASETYINLNTIPKRALKTLADLIEGESVLSSDNNLIVVIML